MSGLQWCPGCQKAAIVRQSEHVVGGNRITTLTCASCGRTLSATQIPIILPKPQKPQTLKDITAMNGPMLISKTQIEG